MFKPILLPTVAVLLAFVTSSSANRPEVERSDRLRKLAEARIQIAHRRLKAIELENQNPPSPGKMTIDLEEFIVWSSRLMDAEFDVATTDMRRIVAVESHVARLKAKALTVKPLVEANRISAGDADLLEYSIVESKSRLIKLTSAPRLDQRD